MSLRRAAGEPGAQGGPPVLQTWVAALAVAAVALAASLAGLRNEFVQDDVSLIVRNPRVHDLANWRLILSSPYWPAPWSQDLYRPLASLTQAVQWALSGGEPGLFRGVSYLLYAGCSVAVFALARRLLPLVVALAAALLFAAHPVHVEAVALAAGQNELVVGLAAVLMVARYLDRRRGAGLRPRDWLWLALLYLAASLFKEQGLVLPGLLLAAELLLLRGPPGARLRVLAPGYAALAALGGLLLLVRGFIFPGNLAGSFVAEALVGLDLSERALTMLQVVPHWFRLLLWPARLSADYTPQEIVASTGLGGMELLGLGLLIATGVLFVWGRRHAPVVAFGIAWCAVALFPVANLVVPTGVVLAERTLLLPSVGFLLALGGLAAWLAERMPERWRQPGFAPARAGIAGLGLLVAALVGLGVVRSALRHRDWQSPRIFIERSVQDAPRSWRTRRGLGLEYWKAGERESGLAAYRRAAELAAPSGKAWEVQNDLARRYFGDGEPARAIQELRTSLAADPRKEQTWNYLILGYLNLGDYQGAIRLADSVLAQGGSPELFGGLRALADTAIRAGAPPGSIRLRIVMQDELPNP